ncbi:MAG: hypothetical protein KGZ92_08035 [Firmicutes bacterium]|nr:hypothetical protein [Dethiobacter sp.]MBS3889216.1 hypothetical protein [Bacillota bacterium]MBS4053870.1 hypothetical protein [Thermaerobacter sp.]
MHITYTLKNSGEVLHGFYDETTRLMRLASGRELDLSADSDRKVAKKLLYNKVVTMPDLKVVTLAELVKG